MQINIIDGPNQEFALRIIEARQNAKLTQQALSDAVGIDKRSISLYENGRMFPRSETIKRLAEALRVDSLWLATGSTEATREYLANQPRPASLPLEVAQLFIEDWHTLGAGLRTKTYVKNPSYGYQSSALQDFVSVHKTFSDQHRATRYPGILPECPGGAIIVFDNSPITLDKIKSGDEVIFEWRNKETEPGLRKAVREPGLNEVFLVPLDQRLPGKPIQIDLHEIKIIGVVVAKIIWNATRSK